MADYRQGDSSSSLAKDVESPSMRNSAGESIRRRWWKTVSDHQKERRRYMHNQVLRIKEEESQTGADFIGDYCDGYVANSHPLDDHFVIWSRLPASPLSRRKIDRND